MTTRVHPGGVIDTRLFLDGDLQLSSVDEHRYHEALVHPVVSGAAEVLILGGGDCLAAREALRHDSVRSVTMVELDAGVVELMRRVDELAVIQDGACDDDRLTIVDDDAFAWVGREIDRGTDGYDAVVVDFPDPDTPALGRLYSVELYAQIEQLLRPGGRVVVQCGSPFFAPEAYWTCADSLEAAGFGVLSYHVDVPSFGDWGFHLAVPDPNPDDGVPAAVDGSDIELASVEGLRFLDATVFAAAQIFPVDVRRARFDTRPSTVLDPSIVGAAQGAWIGYDG